MEGKDGWKDRGGQTSLPAERNPSQHEQPQGIRKAKRDGTKSEDDLGNFASLRQYRNVKNYSCMFEISRLSAARQLGQPMHSQSANFGKFMLNSQNLAGIILHDSVKG